MRLRSPAEVEAAGDARWFRPARARLRSLRDHPDPGLRRFFAERSALLVARAPGRLDVMGGIADYSGALVLELPLARSTSALLQARDEPSVEIVSLREGRPHRFALELAALAPGGELGDPAALAARLEAREDDRWAAYLAGLVQLCLARGASPARGFRLLLDSEVPEGKGISSSAALEVAGMMVLAAHFGLELDPVELASACQWVENHVVGAPCGIMDQMTSACGEHDRLLRLRCQPGTVEGQVPIPAGYRFFGIDSGIRHAVSGADYGTVRTAAFMGYRIVADLAGMRAERDGECVRVEDPLWKGYLANLSVAEFRERFEARLPERLRGADFLARYGGITDPVTRVDPDRVYPVRQATAHPVHEEDRVRRFADLLPALPHRPGSAAELGALMYASHDSYTACGLGSEGTDRLVELAREAGPSAGIFGAKITGGGSGGTVAVLGTDAATGTVREIAARYAAESGRMAELFTETGPGAVATGVLRLGPDEW